MTLLRLILPACLVFSFAIHAEATATRVSAIDAGTWDLNDVSILVPIPDKSSFELMIAPSTPGRGGKIIPDDYFKLIPNLSYGESPDTLRVVGIRIDPCFPSLDTTHPENCHAQIRMVWQPAAASIGAGDAAVHTFYELTPAEFRTFLQELKSINEKSGADTKNLPLGIHPALSKQGLRGPYWSALKPTILKYAGGSNISKITLMTRDVDATKWAFGGWDIVQHRAQPISIPRIRSELQTMENSAAGEFSGSIVPSPSGADTFDSLADTSWKKDITKVRAWTDVAYRIENPTILNPNNVDCVSCHMAQSVRSWALNLFPNDNLESSPFKFESSFNLTNLSSSSKGSFRLFRDLRAFGYYLGNTVSISQRTINESAVIAKWLNQNVEEK